MPGIYGGEWGSGFSNYGFLWVNGENSGSSSASTAYTGGGAAHENRPPYYALAYIMKL
jgi:microcystin-dependent protein